MKLLERILWYWCLPGGLLLAPTYFIEEIRWAVCDYISEAFIPPVGLFLFFVYGAFLGLLAGLLVTPDAALELAENQEDLRESLGITATTTVRAMVGAMLLVALFAAWIIWSKAYGTE